MEGQTGRGQRVLRLGNKAESKMTDEGLWQERAGIREGKDGVALTLDSSRNSRWRLWKRTVGRNWKVSGRPNSHTNESGSVRNCVKFANNSRIKDLML